MKNKNMKSLQELKKEYEQTIFEARDNLVVKLSEAVTKECEKALANILGIMENNIHQSHDVFVSND